INRGAKLLLANHVEKPLDRPYRRSCQQSDGQHEHPRITVFEPRAEQIEKRLAKGKKADRDRKRRPENPPHGTVQERFEFFTGTARVIFTEAMRSRRRD